MPTSIAMDLATLALGQTTTLYQVRVSRRSLLGFHVEGSDELIDAREAALRIAKQSPKAPPEQPAPSAIVETGSMATAPVPIASIPSALEQSPKANIPSSPKPLERCSDVLGTGSAARRGARRTKVRCNEKATRMGLSQEQMSTALIKTTLAGPVKAVCVRVILCTRCFGDGLGRRNRGTCKLCHGDGIQVVAPPGGFGEADQAQLVSALEQATIAIRGAVYPKARESLRARIAELLPLVAADVRKRILAALGREGTLLGGTRAA